MPTIPLWSQAFKKFPHPCAPAPSSPFLASTATPALHGQTTAPILLWVKNKPFWGELGGFLLQLLALNTLIVLHVCSFVQTTIFWTVVPGIQLWVFSLPYFLFRIQLGTILLTSAFGALVTGISAGFPLISSKESETKVLLVAYMALCTSLLAAFWPCLQLRFFCSLCYSHIGNIPSILLLQILSSNFLIISM